MINAAQIKAARALLGMGQVELSELAGVGITTVKRLELSTSYGLRSHALENPNCAGGGWRGVHPSR